MTEILDQLLESLTAGRPVAYCRLVETRGSTPQKAGAMMLVFADGTQAGTLGGGCVEAEVKRQALAILESDAARIVCFQLDSDYGWDDGLICGGRMQVLIDPLRTPANRQYVQTLASVVLRGQGCLEAIVFDTAASGLPTPSSYLFNADTELVASTSGSLAPPDLVMQNLPSLRERPRPRAAHGVSYLASVPRCRLLIVGGGHIGQAVGQLAVDLDFKVSVVDDRAEYVSEARFPRAEHRLTGDIGQVLSKLEITPDTYCLIVTRGHNHDEEALYHLAERGARYVGMIGSQRKIRLIFEDLLEQGVSADALAKVYAPVGIDIGSQTVPEIAVSILAELIAHRNCAGHVPGRPASLMSAETA